MDKGVVPGILSIKRGVFMDKIPDQAGDDVLQPVQWPIPVIASSLPSWPAPTGHLIRARSLRRLRSHRQTG